MSLPPQLAAPSHGPAWLYNPRETPPPMNASALRCPACHAPAFDTLGRDLYKCSYCGTTFRQAAALCPACGRPQQEGAEICPDCGEPLTLLGTVIARQSSPRAPYWLAVARSAAPAIQAEDERASRLRMDALREIDRRRLEAEAEAEARRREQDRSTLTWAAVASGVIALFFIVLVATTLLR